MNWIQRIARLFGFGRKVIPTGAGGWEWAEDNFFTAHKAKTERLAAIARERTALKVKLEKARREKKARRQIYAALQELKNEELGLGG